MTDKQVYTVDEAAELWGMNDQTVRRWCRDGELQAAKMGRHYRISRQSLADFWRERGGGELFAPRMPKPITAAEWNGGLAAREAIKQGREPLEPTDDDLSEFASLMGRALTEGERKLFINAFHRTVEGHRGADD